MDTDEMLREIANSSSTPVVWLLLAAGTAIVLLLCVWGLRCSLLKRYRLGSLLILSWICVADFGFVVHRIVFFLLNTIVLTIPSRLLMTWTCKLYHAFESLLVLVQTWLLVLLAMERVTVKLQLRLGLRYFSRLRLRVGIVIAGAVAFSLHINYIYVFAPVQRSFYPAAADGNTTVGGGLELNVSGEISGFVCSVDDGFETFYNFVKVAEVLLGVYLPVLIINCSAALLCTHCIARGFTDLRSHATRLLRPGATGDARAVAFLSRCNNAMDLLFLMLSLGCYLPLEAMGVYKVLAVHRSAANQQLYDLLYSLFLPAKNLLDALVIGLVLIYLLSMARRRCPVSPKIRKRSCGGGGDGVNGNGSCNGQEEGEDRVDSAGNVGRNRNSGTREPMELVELNPDGRLI